MAVDALTGVDGVEVDNTDPLNPIVRSDELDDVLDRLIECGPVAAGISDAGLQCWLDVASPYQTKSGIVVFALHDRSGNGRNFDQGTPNFMVTGVDPGLNGLYECECDGAKGLASAGDFDFLHEGPSTLFFVARRDFPFTVIPTLLGNTGLTGFTDKGFSYDQEGGSTTLIVGNGGGVGYSVFAPLEMPESEWHVVSVQLDPLNPTTADRAFGWIDGVDQSIVNTGTQPAGTGAADGSMCLCTSPSELSDGWAGGFAELIIYNRLLTTPEREAVEAYLSTKWGL